jgi:D-threo-aldose 1-dehydrogenase
MRTTIIGGTIQTTVLGFGCARLFRLPSRRQRRRVLDAAFDAGIRHYDVAPMYGLGLAERELAALARAHPNTVVVATKFGIDPSQFAGGLAYLQGPIRRVLARVPALQRGAMSAAAGPRSGPLGKLLYRWRGYDAAAARASLQRSLRRLG